MNPPQNIIPETKDTVTIPTKEYFVLGGDGYTLKQSVVFATTTAKTAFGWFVDVSIKEAAVRALHPTFNDTQWGLLKGALVATQNISVVPSSTAVPA